jgi:transcriptional regulator with XRE-family HTH domain
MKDRIRTIRKDQGMTQEVFGEAVGASRAMIGFYETGKVVPDKPIIMLICEKFRVNQAWLETGEGEPYKVSPNYSILRALDAMPDLQEAFAAVLPELTVQDIKNINDLLKKFKKALGK